MLSAVRAPSSNRVRMYGIHFMALVECDLSNSGVQVPLFTVL
jgi:hypothetical protein